jgi:hypothetical protein
MRTSPTSCLSTSTAPAELCEPVLLADFTKLALLDELSKIGAEAQPKPSAGHQVLRALGTAGAGALGAGAGLGLGQLITRHPIFQPSAAEHAAGVLTPGRAVAVKIVLPILGGAALMLADRYRRKMDEGMSIGRGK